MYLYYHNTKLVSIIILVFPVIWMIPDAIRAGRRIKYKDLEINGKED